MLNHHQVAEIIKEVGLPGIAELPPGVKEGSYWHGVSKRYLRGAEPNFGDIRIFAILSRWDLLRGVYFSHGVT